MRIGIEVIDSEGSTMISREDTSKEILVYLMQRWRTPYARAIRIAEEQADYIHLVDSLSSGGFNREVIGEVLEICQDCAEMKEEGRSLGTSFVIGRDYDNIKNMLPEPKGISHEEHCAGQIWETVSQLLGVVDGELMTFVLDSGGGTICVRSLEVPDTGYLQSPFVPLKYQKISCITRATVSLAFVVPKNQTKVRIFRNGHLIEDLLRTKKTGKQWIYRNYANLSHTLAALAKEMRLPRRKLQRLVGIFIEMTAQGKGTLAFVGDHKKVIEISEPPSISIEPFDISQASDDEIVNLAKEDGAIILDSRFRFWRITDPVRPIGQQVENAPKMKVGIKHKTAKTTSIETKALSISVSEGGTITFYKDGNIILRL